MDSLIGIFISSFIIALSGAVVPGPVLSVTISESAKNNFWAGPLIIVGHGILELLLILFLIAGFADFINDRKVLSVVSIVGGLYLLGMAFVMLRDVKNVTADFRKGNNAWGGPVVAGIMTSIANPYWIIWWATIGLGYIFVSIKYGWIGVMTFFVGHILADFSWYSMVSFVVSRRRKFMSDKKYRGLITICALVLIIFGITFTIWGIRGIAGFIESV